MMNKISRLGILAFAMIALNGCAAVDAADCVLDIVFLPVDCLFNQCSPC